MKKIIFNPPHPNTIPHPGSLDKYLMPYHPVPASDIIPDWWKDGELFFSGSGENSSLIIKDEKNKNPGMKACIPILDSLMSGYFIVLHRDIEILESDNNKKTINWRYVIKDENGEWVEDNSHDNFEAISERTGVIGYTMPRPSGYSFNHMVWTLRWGVETPRGWSVLFTHPLNQFQLPFITGSGIMDNDKYGMNGNIPFFLKENFTGIIEKGTPMVQLIPIKRASWISYTKRKLSKKNQWKSNMPRSVGYGWYKKNAWTKKIYESKDK